MIFMHLQLAILLAASPLCALGFAVPKLITSREVGCKTRKRSSRVAQTDHDVIENVERKQDYVDDITVDRAPCFDGVCDSQPVDGDVNVISEAAAGDVTEGNAGEAILRLGTMTGPTVWSEFGRISQEYDVANLGQGVCPDFQMNCELHLHLCI
jgi:hypothetical protein